MPMTWCNECWADIARHFSVRCLAAIPSPEFTYPTPNAPGKKLYNAEFLDLFEAYAGTYALLKRELVIDGELSETFHRSPRLTVAGDIQKSVIKQRGQFQPLHSRNIIYLNDLYPEDDVRFKDRQRIRDIYLNLYTYPEWMRDAVRTHLLMKVSDGDLSPGTLPNYFKRFQYLRDFMYEKFDPPNPLCFTESLFEDDFIAWGNEHSLKGKIGGRTL